VKKTIFERTNLNLGYGLGLLIFGVIGLAMSIWGYEYPGLSNIARIGTIFSLALFILISTFSTALIGLGFLSWLAQMGTEQSEKN